MRTCACVCVCAFYFYFLFFMDNIRSIGRPGCEGDRTRSCGRMRFAFSRSALWARQCACVHACLCVCVWLRQCVFLSCVRVCVCGHLVTHPQHVCCTVRERSYSYKGTGRKFFFVCVCVWTRFTTAWVISVWMPVCVRTYVSTFSASDGDACDNCVGDRFKDLQLWCCRHARLWRWL